MHCCLGENCIQELFYRYIQHIVFTGDISSFCESGGSPACCFHRNSSRMRKKTNKHLSVLNHHTLWQATVVDFSSYLPSLSPCSHLREHISLHLYGCIVLCVCVCVYMLALPCMWLCVICVCLHVSETRHDLVSGEGLGSPGPAHSRPDSAAELINISLQSKVGSAMRPQGCTNWWKLTAG